jgi:hypothetical protein
LLIVKALFQEGFFGEYRIELMNRRTRNRRTRNRRTRNRRTRNRRTRNREQGTSVWTGGFPNSQIPIPDWTNLF